MDFSKETVKDLPSHGVSFLGGETVTCWLLEGLIMYLKKEENDKLFQEISDLSPSGSYLILNFMNGSPAASSDGAHAILTEAGWQREEILHFGEQGFNYGRFPEGKQPNACFGFSFYTKG